MCSLWQHVAVCWGVSISGMKQLSMSLGGNTNVCCVLCSALQCGAMHMSGCVEWWQCVAVCCGACQCVAVRGNGYVYMCTVCCSVLQCVSVHCSAGY